MRVCITCSLAELSLATADAPLPGFSSRAAAHVAVTDSCKHSVYMHNTVDISSVS
jgi:hypothetical protein